MQPPAPAPPGSDLEPHRTYLMILARMNWDEVLQRWCEPADVVNKTLFEAQRDRGDFRGHADAQLRAWLRKILFNTMCDARRAALADVRDVTREQSLEAAFEESSRRIDEWLAASDSSPSDRAVAAEQRALLAAALAQLPTDQMQVMLHKMDDLTNEQTAERMGRTRDSVAGLYARGLAELRRLMRKQG